MKIYKILLLIDTALNFVITKIFNGFGLIFQKIVPTVLRTKVKKILEYFSSLRRYSLSDLKQSVIERIKAFRFTHLLTHSKEWLIEKKSQLAKIDFKKFDELKSTIYNFFFNFYLTFIRFLYTLYRNYTALSLIASLVILTTIIFFANFKFYTFTQKQKHLKAEVIRMLKKNSLKKPYHKIEQRSLKLDPLKISIDNSDVNDIQALQVEFVVVANNQETVLFLRKHMDLVNDHILTNINPTISDFLLEKEGKGILNEKIKNELNAFLQEMDVTGKIELVFIEGVIGT